MTGADFLNTLNARIAPRTVTNLSGASDSLTIKLSDGTTLTMKRQRVRDTKDQAELDAYVDELLAS